MDLSITIPSRWISRIFWEAGVWGQFRVMEAMVAGAGLLFWICTVRLVPLAPRFAALNWQTGTGVRVGVSVGGVVAVAVGTGVAVAVGAGGLVLEGVVDG